jgi:hypothetical protein
MMKPSIGRIVHYVDPDGEHFAAIITGVWTDHCVNLVVFELCDGCPSAVRTSVMFDGGAAAPFVARTWHWPERE